VGYDDEDDEEEYKTVGAIVAFDVVIDTADDD
jgi:hypothetical protein